MSASAGVADDVIDLDFAAGTNATRALNAGVEIVEAGLFPLTVTISNARLIAGFGTVL